MYYLKSNVVAEPLINRWYASLSLISPASAAMQFTFSHQKIMASYIAAPHIHEMACRNPETMGGPFIDYPEQRVADIQCLLDNNKTELKDFIEFANSIKTLHSMLEKHPQGMSLEPLYSDIPDTMSGYIELYYDLANRPHFRFIEALLYLGPLNTARLQSVTLSLTHQDYRPFCLSTPRLHSDSELSITLPFRHSVYDQLFHSRERALSADDLHHLMVTALGINSPLQAPFTDLFTTEKPASTYQPLRCDEPLRIRYFGHACILIESQQCTILIDPALSYVYPSESTRFTYADLPEKIDYVLLTHTHQDHVLLEHLIQLRYKIGSIIVPSNVPGALQDPSLKLMLEDLGFTSVIALNEFEKKQLPEGYIQGLPFLGEHSDLHINSKLIYLINIAGIKILCAADSNNFCHPIYENIHAAIGDVDLLFIGMECVGAPLSWLYQPLMLSPLTREMDQSRRLNGSDFEKAKQIVDLFHCTQVYVYAMGQEPWLNYIMATQYTPQSAPIVESDRLIAYCKANNIRSARLFGAEEITIDGLI